MLKLPESDPADKYIRSMIREIIVYDINRDTYIIRHDVLAGEGQLTAIGYLAVEAIESIEDARAELIATIRRHLDELKKPLESLRRLPLPGSSNVERYLSD